MTDRRYNAEVAKYFFFTITTFIMFAPALTPAEPPIASPPPGHLYHGLYWGGVGTDDHDPTEHDVSAADVNAYERGVGAKVTWIYFSNNWFESRDFPTATCHWIKVLG